DGVGRLAGDDAVLHGGAQVGVAPAVAALGLVEGVGLGLGVGVVGAPVAQLEAVLARPAHRRQVVVGRPGGEDDVDEVGAVVQNAFQLLLKDLALAVPVGGGGVIGHLHLDREGDALGREFLDGGVAVLL